MSTQIIIAAVTAVLQLLEQVVLPNLTPGGTAATVITVIEQLVPLVEEAVTELAVPFKNILAAIKATGAVTADQLDQLDAFEATIDTALDDAIKSSQDEEDAAASGTASTTT